MRRHRFPLGGISPGVMLLGVVVLMFSVSGALAGPRLVLVPNPVKSGESVSVSGHEFCVSPDCSAIAVELAGEILVEGAPVRKDGTFLAGFDATVPPGRHEVVATQRDNATGEIIRTFTFLIVGVGEQEPGPTPEMPR